ncbi:MAG: beta-lactamase family protein, partial [Parachlamydiaceae bacterium]|nr:beta-lactamase family protein [Parachlamydiaceae bacterium]
MSVEIPETLVGHQFSAFLSVFNSGDKEQFQKFKSHYKNPAEHDVDQELRFFQLTGGFKLKKINEATLNKLSALVQEVNSDQFGRLDMEVEQDPPYAITQLEITAVEAPIEFKIERMAEAQTISATEMRIDQLAKQNHFSGSVLVSKKDKTIFAKSVGFSNMERKLPNDIKTKFNLGSMNKMFTAVSIAQLAQQGRLNLNDTIGKYLLSYRNIETSKVTIHQLLTHTGGTGDIFGSDYEKNLEKLN